MGGGPASYGDTGGDKLCMLLLLPGDDCDAAAAVVGMAAYEVI